MKTLRQCEAFLARVGIATALPSRVFPSLLWEARGHRERVGWDAHCERIWGWKDELPARKIAWAGRLFSTQVCLVHRDVLPCLLRWRGAPSTLEEVQERYRAGKLSREALRIAGVLDEPMGRQALRAATGLQGKANTAPFERGTRWLEHGLILTRAGRVSEGSGWDSCTYARVIEWFPDLLSRAAELSYEEACAAVSGLLTSAGVDEKTARRLLRDS